MVVDLPAPVKDTQKRLCFLGCIRRTSCSCVTGRLSRADAGGTGRVPEEEVGASAAACCQDGQVRWIHKEILDVWCFFGMKRYENYEAIKICCNIHIIT
jgi:hypothetical protein